MLRSAVPDASLEWAVSRAERLARLLSDALHDQHDWVMQYDRLMVPVERIFEPSGVLLRAEFPEHCWIVPPKRPQIELHRQMRQGCYILLAITPIDHPGDGAFVVEWRYSAESVVIAA